MAIKDEMPPEKNEYISVLPYEAKVYELLRGHEGIPRIHWYGMHGGAHVMIMDKLGPNLQQLRRMCRGKFSMKTVLMLAEQLVRIDVSVLQSDPDICDTFPAHKDRVCALTRNHLARYKTREFCYGAQATFEPGLYV